MEVEIRPLHILEEIEACTELQRRIWGSNDLDVVPSHVLITAARNGGVLLGAFVDGELVGFVFGFLGTDERRGREAPAAVKLKHCSHQLGVLPEWQDKGIGYRLKLAQREAVRNQGL
ncbi:MAG: GNAT family N-acetyltransferase, partial [Anaerolineae bacterium]|nr:GNAT family N-acetyltransferase [Anaerolineae bacterium]